ncbi:hypothetical protein KKC97_06665 [bacterium]|nr:hypothetical protein [bacterium]MBU1637335.1 hypothetical protein [bacterium]MBU1920119.1 hypothetical protein [bacterium]
MRDLLWAMRINGEITEDGESVLTALKEATTDGVILFPLEQCGTGYFPARVRELAPNAVIIAWSSWLDIPSHADYKRRVMEFCDSCLNLPFTAQSLRGCIREGAIHHGRSDIVELLDLESPLTAI